LGVEDREVHLALGIFEDAEVGEFVGEPGEVVVGVGGFDADKDREARADLADDLVVDLDAGLRDALDDGAHGGGYPDLGGLRSGVSLARLAGQNPEEGLDVGVGAYIAVAV